MIFIQVSIKLKILNLLISLVVIFAVGFNVKFTVISVRWKPIGAILDQQLFDGTYVPLGFFSRKLSEAEQKYSIYDQELLAIFTATKHFQRILEGRRFITFTDHRLLTHALKQRSEKASPRQIRQLDFKSQYDTHLKYTPVEENAVADALPRAETVSTSAACNLSTISAEREKYKPLQHLLTIPRLKL